MTINFHPLFESEVRL